MQDRETDVVSVAVEARIRQEAGHTGNVISFKDARSPFRGSTLGRMFLDGTIDRAQFEAGTRYAETKGAYHSATGIPWPTPRAQQMFQARGSVEALTDSAVNRARAAADRMMMAEGWLLSIPSHPHDCRRVVNLVAFEDEELARFWPQTAPHMVKWLKRGLDALVSGFGIASNSNR